jgi:ASC-1-like (ASCH) protein
MSEEKKEKEKEIKVGDSITFSEKVTVIKIRGEAVKELGQLPQNLRQEVANEAVELSKGTIHPYDVTLQEVIEAKKRKGVQS